MLLSTAMEATDYGLIEVLTVKPHLEVAKKYSYSSLSKKYFDRCFTVATLFYCFPPDKWSRILSTQTLSLVDLENDSLLEESGIATRCPYYKFLWTNFSRFLVH